MTWFASAPANIALIKYMGKSANNNVLSHPNNTRNTPTNPSLSYTLNHLQSFVELEHSSTSCDQWQPLPGHTPLALNEQEQTRFLSHLSFIKKQFHYSACFYVRSSNNFPASCGLASSASSFAALTRCAVQAICEQQNRPLPSIQDLSALSRQGSGSSCRSFFEPFALWQQDYAEALPLPYPSLRHMTVIVSQAQKKVSSSQAHQAVFTSLQFENRPQRAQTRLTQLIHALQQQDWFRAYQLTWQEFWDMHALFETATPPFGYFLPGTMMALHLLREYWHIHQDGPLVTMDAGPNIHLLFRPEQQTVYQEIADTLSPHFQLFTPHI
ncbi:MAG: diphosphomevalonate decarboxylase [Gammaproteobacteria bacterium]|nr:diphosphomevalonate decarboxylase [Gammaproteobacteria bacterium]